MDQRCTATPQESPSPGGRTHVVRPESVRVLGLPERITDRDAS